MSSTTSRAALRCCRSMRAVGIMCLESGSATSHRSVVARSTARIALQRRALHSSRARMQIAPTQASKYANPEAVSSAKKAPISDISKDGLADEPPLPTASSSAAATLSDAGIDATIDWARSFQGLSTVPFSDEAAAVLQAPLNPEDVEIKPDGILYLPEIKYRRILNKAFRPGGWGLAPRGETIVTGKTVTREYALVVLGRLASVARGEQDYFSPDGIPTATEGCRSNALMRCCKDLGIASELWDPRFIRDFMKKNAKEVWVEHVTTKKKKKIFLRKDGSVTYPFKETKA